LAIFAIACIGVTALTGCAPDQEEGRYSSAAAALKSLAGVSTVDVTYESRFLSPPTTTANIDMRDGASARQVSAALEVIKRHGIPDALLTVGDDVSGATFSVDGAIPDSVAIEAEVGFWFALRARIANGAVSLREGQNEWRTGDPFERSVTAVALKGSMAPSEAANWLERAMSLPRPPGGTAWQVILSKDDTAIQQTEPSFFIDVGVDPAPALALWRTLSAIAIPDNADVGSSVSVTRTEIEADGDCPGGEIETWDTEVGWNSDPDKISDADTLGSEPEVTALTAALDAYQTYRRGSGEFSVHRFDEQVLSLSDRNCNDPKNTSQLNVLDDALSTHYVPRPCACPVPVTAPATR
jgi:hypothetical protein